MAKEWRGSPDPSKIDGKSKNTCEYITGLAEVGDLPCRFCGEVNDVMEGIQEEMLAAMLGSTVSTVFWTTVLLCCSRCFCLMQNRLLT